MRGFDFRRLNDKTTIAINKSLLVLPKAKLLWWSDERFFRQHLEEIKKHKEAYKAKSYINCYREKNPEWVSSYSFSNSGMKGYDERPGYLCHGNNSGYAALHLAIKLGAKKIILLGYDFKFDAQKNSHWHDGHVDELGRSMWHGEDTLTKNMLPNFQHLQVPALRHRVIIINSNPDSNLDVWPRQSIEELL